MNKIYQTLYAEKSAGILLVRFCESFPEVLLMHPGGPFWANKDVGAWSIPKGEFEENENPLDAAKRELSEETGIEVKNDFVELTPVKQKSGKLIFAWSLQKDVDTATIHSNNFELESPPKSGKKKLFPEIDKAAWFILEEAKGKIEEGQVPLIRELATKLDNLV